ncbi:uncharacterized protein LOC105444805 [Strongylocentrotus purpuratus]|uniref:Uncharacterized protein n=1 Tax=Strongylocentrotus purpuratus TaxID=7668 RepID=A0A7M7HHR8_STRPU|nr:uncharacterized protein LOC105444805 [Strongylocentrotus purpuratus]|eukprot:XP_011677817.1 PREDICTED: dentin sialophosphoprotein-like [Strongylocentrotus purpuratus]
MLQDCFPQIRKGNFRFNGDAQDDLDSFLYALTCLQSLNDSDGLDSSSDSDESENSADSGNSNDSDGLDISSDPDESENSAHSGNSNDSDGLDSSSDSDESENSAHSGNSNDSDGLDSSSDSDESENSADLGNSNELNNLADLVYSNDSDNLADLGNSIDSDNLVDLGHPNVTKFTKSCRPDSSSQISHLTNFSSLIQSTSSTGSDKDFHVGNTSNTVYQLSQTDREGSSSRSRPYKRKAPCTRSRVPQDGPEIPEKQSKYEI